MLTTGASRKAPTIPLLAILNSTPLETLFEKKAMEACIRLKRNGSWLPYGSTKGHWRVEKKVNRLKVTMEGNEMAPKWRAVKNLTRQAI